MNQAITISQIIVSSLLVITILLQQRGTTLGAIFGQSGSFYFKRRGLEKFIFVLSIILSCLFIGLSLASLIL